MPITSILGPGRNGLAANHAAEVQVKWQSISATCAAGLGNKQRFVNSGGIWAHVAFILADPANATDVLFGPTGNASSRTLAAGTEYEIPPVYPNIENAWAVFDLSEWWFCCVANSATIIILYV